MTSSGIRSSRSALGLLMVPALALALAACSREVAAPASPTTSGTVTTLSPTIFEDATRTADATFAYKKIGDLELPMAVFLPKDRTSLTERRPAVLCIHGGAWSGWKGGDVTAWDGSVFAPHARYFAARGAVAVNISYRNVVQPGKDKAGFAAGNSLFDLQSDCRSAIRYLRQHADQFGIDPQRIAVIGDSAGGHLAATLGNIDRYDAPGEDRSISGMANLVIACNPIVDLLDPAWITYVHETPSAWEGDKPLASREERAKAISPLWNVSPASPPTLIIHGLKDSVVLPRHATDFHEALKKAGVDSEISLLPEASHAFILLGYRTHGGDFLSVMRTVDRFLVSHHYLNGTVDVASPAPRGQLTTIVGDRIVDGRIPGSNGLALVLPDAQKPKVATVVVVEDAQRGKVLKIGKGVDGLTLTGQAGLGTTATVSLWVNPDKGPGTLVRRSVGTSVATGFLVALGKQNEVTLKVAGQTLTGPILPVGKWSRVVAAIAPGRSTLTVEGSPAVEAPLSDAALIGSQFVVGESFGGLLADVRIFDTAVTAAEATH